MMSPDRHPEVAGSRERRCEWEEKDSLEQRIANMTREQRLARMRELLEPMRQYLHELDENGEALSYVSDLPNGALRVDG
jgi:hypothetical protein